LSNGSDLDHILEGGSELKSYYCLIHKAVNSQSDFGLVAQLSLLRCTLESSFRKLRIQFLRAELELRRLSCESLARKFEKRPLTYEQRTDLFRRWEETLKESHLLQAMLDMLEREEKETARNGMSGDTMTDSQRFTFFTWFYHAKDKTPAA
jgi:hypothetical protein